MFVELPFSFFKRIVHAAATGCGPHYIFNAYIRGLKVFGSHVVTDIAFGYDSDQVDILNEGCAPAS